MGGSPGEGRLELDLEGEVGCTPGEGGRAGKGLEAAASRAQSGCCPECGGLIQIRLSKRAADRIRSCQAGSHRLLSHQPDGIVRVRAAALLSLAPLLRRDQEDEGTSFPASERNSTCLRTLFPKHLLAPKSLVSRCQSGNGIYCMWPAPLAAPRDRGTVGPRDNPPHLLSSQDS